VPQNPPIVVREFTPDEINREIEKLKRRVDDVKALDSQKIGFDDVMIDNVENRIRETIREIFGPQSPEFHDHQYHKIWHGGYGLMDNYHQRQAKFAAGIS